MKKACLLIFSALMAMVVAVVAPSSAYADPVLQPGCVDGSHEYDYAGPSYYATTSLHVCWNGGNISGVQLTDVSGNITANGQTLWNVINNIGPVTVDRVPILSSDVFGSYGYARIYYFFDSEDCFVNVAGGIICSPYTTHTLYVDVDAQSGSLTWGNDN